MLILGETGVGKEHVATFVHRKGPRRDKPFVAVNCAAIPATLLESTLFGHERGAFTGATQRSPGVFEQANGGVLFLDEVGDLGSSAQSSLLRAIETRRITRIGSTAEIAVDVRIVAATHCDLAAMVEEGTFRQDLFYRLDGIQIELPALRERQDEIEPLARLFVARACAEWGIAPRTLAPDALDALRSYAWPGNVRQLRHAVERAVLLGSNPVIHQADLPEYVVASTARAESPVLSVSAVPGLPLREQLRRYERLLLEDALARAGGNRQVAAKLLRIPLRTLFRKLRAKDPSDDPEGQVP